MFTMREERHDAADMVTVMNEVLLYSDDSDGMVKMMMMVVVGAAVGETQGINMNKLHNHTRKKKRIA